jgi:hypothetical protein
VRELFEEDRGEIEIAVKTDVVALEVLEHAEEREIGLGGSLVEPLHSMGPGAVIDDVRQVRVQREGEKSCRTVWRCLRQDAHLKLFLLGAARRG